MPRTPTGPRALTAAERQARWRARMMERIASLEAEVQRLEAEVARLEAAGLTSGETAGGVTHG